MSWEVLEKKFQWHGLQQFTNAEAVKLALKAGPSEDGVYVLAPHTPTEGLSAEEAEAAKRKDMEAMETEMFVFATVRPNGTTPMMTTLIIQAVLNVIAAGFMTWFIGCSTVRGWILRVGFGKMIALWGIIFITGSNYVWWGYSPIFALTSAVDVMVGWGLAASVIALNAKKAPAAGGGAE